MSPRTRLLLTILPAIAVLAGCAATPAVTPTPTPAGAEPQQREFHVFTATLEFNEDAVGLPHDVFAPDTLFVNKGDTVTIHFHNTEDTDEHHTFTMAEPYKLSYDVAPGGEANATFVADHAGIFAYTCGFHQPTMTGYLVVLG